MVFPEIYLNCGKLMLLIATSFEVDKENKHILEGAVIVFGI
jgi:hypothetical protein